MRNGKIIQTALGLSIMFSFLAGDGFCQQTSTRADIQKITLYVRRDPKDKDFGKSSFSFQYGVRSDIGKEITKNHWDIK
jgi:hypothetical protein